MLPGHSSVFENELSETIRRYLAEIYHLSQAEAWISPTRLAAGLNVTTPATTRMIKCLAQRGLIEYERYQGLRLSAAGRRVALSDLRRLRLAERFLVDQLGFGWHEAHPMACQMSKNLPLDVVKRIEVLLGYPQHCPYGEPIPTDAGEMFTLDDRPLTTLPIGATGRVSRVKTREPEQLCYLAEWGLVPGAAFELTNRLPFNGPVQLKVGSLEPVIGFELAAMLWTSCSTC